MHIINIVFSSSTQTPPDLGQSSTGFAILQGKGHWEFPWIERYSGVGHASHAKHHQFPALHWIPRIQKVKTLLEGGEKL
jgi:hypothetical protein